MHVDLLSSAAPAGETVKATRGTGLVRAKLARQSHFLSRRSKFDRLEQIQDGMAGHRLWMDILSASASLMISTVCQLGTAGADGGK